MMNSTSFKQWPNAHDRRMWSKGAESWPFESSSWYMEFHCLKDCLWSFWASSWCQGKTHCLSPPLRPDLLCFRKIKEHSILPCRKWWAGWNVKLTWDSPKRPDWKWNRSPGGVAPCSVPSWQWSPSPTALQVCSFSLSLSILHQQVQGLQIVPPLTQSLNKFGHQSQDKLPWKQAEGFQCYHKSMCFSPDNQLNKTRMFQEFLLGLGKPLRFAVGSGLMVLPFLVS